ncbi:1-deoxy-D-xylulose-5-phosphate reductoisomerase [Roseicyclus sp. F158]|uniref:1-deoxy-D-xylulose 5-phosphate reductoisomerase n=1 Tax=Tropicimonas omnivorans TaxID=3075590 RepID=A0ABU3DJ18_9RHOB|nr:1-deoxy-D-xylulose-5-phosphate reductoisomerase [Roseicyclus sp. F158]MDT0683716.1 1-deoxy-D-xylulose-5-phosphate reductoisomerase [Roseicyclus sp. F158]
MKRVSILGSTGSIGQSTLSLIAGRPGEYDVVALTGGRNVELLARQAAETGAAIAVTSEPDLLDQLRDALPAGIEAAAGAEAIAEAAARRADWVMSAIVGAAGLAPGLAAIETGTTLALANKETLVAAGPLVLSRAAASGATILPVDSEHSAIFQALRGEDPAAVERVIITASGGALRDWPMERLAEATPEEAGRHPNWAMGNRITVDSASMFNKALEVIEAKEFFGFSPDRIEVLIHHESIVHALVGFVDGGVMAHLGPPDMRHAIGHALDWPDRRALPVERLDLAKIGQLSFRPPDEARWPALRLARDVMARGGLTGAAFNAAKEAALDAFLARQMRFTDMAHIVETVLDEMDASGETSGRGDISLGDVLETDAAARARARGAATRLSQTV